MSILNQLFSKSSNSGDAADYLDTLATPEDLLIRSEKRILVETTISGPRWISADEWACGHLPTELEEAWDDPIELQKLIEIALDSKIFEEIHEAAIQFEKLQPSADAARYLATIDAKQNRVKEAIRRLNTALMLYGPNLNCTALLEELKGGSGVST